MFLFRLINKKKNKRLEKRIFQSVLIFKIARRCQSSLLKTRSK